MAAKKPSAKTSGPPSSKLARFGIPVPARVAKFFDGPELAAHADVKAWGMSGWSGDTKMKVQWGSPKLAGIFDYATDGYFDPEAKTKFLPIAAVGSETHMFAVDVTHPSLPVYFFDYESGFSKWADDFDAFLKRLLKKGERTPAERLEKAYEKASALHEKKKYDEILKLLEPVVAEFPETMDFSLDDTSETLGAAHNLIGIALEHKKEIDRAMKHYEIGLKLGSDSGGLNVCDLWLNHFKDYAKLVEYASKLADGVWAIGGDTYAWFHVHNYLGLGHLLTGNREKALGAYHRISTIAVSDPDKIERAVKDLREAIAERPEIDKQGAEEILSWLAVPAPAPPAEKIAALRAWWRKLPEGVQTALREALKFEKEPDDATFARMADLTELSVNNAELSDLAWVTMLEKLDDLSVQGNAIKDLSPLSKLVRLTRLDVGQNKVKSLKPLAALKRLQRLSAGENPLEGLQGLESLHDLDYLHVNEAGLKSLEPLRGLAELAELTIYENKIDDLSPLAECPRLKEISSFGNPLRKGFAELGKLRWLEEVQAGDKTKAADIKALRAANPDIDIDAEFVEGLEDEDGEEKPDPLLPEIRAWWATVPVPWRKRFERSFDKEDRGKKDPSDKSLLDLAYEDALFLEKAPDPNLEILRRFDHCDHLNVCESNVTDLGPIGGLPRLRALLIRDNPVTSLAPLAASKSVEEIYFARCKVASLAGLEGVTTLRELHGEDNPLEDVSALAGLRELREVDFEGGLVTSVAAFGKLRRLRKLALGLNRVTDLSPLAGCEQLRTLEIWGNPGVKNAVALAELEQLESIISHGSLPKSEIEELRRKRPDIRVD